MRAGKLKVPVIQGVHDKLTSLKDLAHKENFEFNRIFFIGNDLNDYFPMVRSGYSACPFDSHEKIKEVATYVLEVNGGEGVARELLENIFNLDFLHILYGGSST
jgi:YrbI family 3-deoxy-D-manno-octulosonate 8-phosphate phosphatase